MALRVAVIGHVEWVTHCLGPLPAVGQIGHLAGALDEPAGGGAVTAARIAELGAECRFFTALSSDGFGEVSAEVLREHGIHVHAAERAEPQPRAISVVEESGERTILVTGGRLTPTIDDALPWRDLARCEAAFFTGDDPRTLLAARAARHLVVTARRIPSLVKSGVRADVVVASATDLEEQFDAAALPVAPRAIVFTEGAAGGRIVVADQVRRYAAVAPDGPVADTYGAGDSFAAGLTVGLARGLRLDDAVALGARCGAAALTTRGGGPGWGARPAPGARRRAPPPRRAPGFGSPHGDPPGSRSLIRRARLRRPVGLGDAAYPRATRCRKFRPCAEVRSTAA